MSGARTVLAFLVAPVAIPFVFAFTSLLGPLFSEPDNTVKNGSFLTGLLIFSAYGIVIAYLCELTFGIAAWKIFKRFGIRSILAFAAAGAVMGWLVTMVITRRLADVSNPYFWFDLAAGICCCSVFRLVVFSGSREAQSE
jgi:hypothetical protein